MKKLASVFLAVALAATLAGCQAAVKPSAVGTLEFRVTDAPAKDEVTAVIITVSKIQVHKAGAGETATPTASPSPEASPTTSPSPSPSPTPSPTPEKEGEWLTIEIPGGSKSFDLLKVKGLEEFLASGQLAAGKYTQVRLIVDKAEVALGGGEPKSATVPSGELKLVHPFDIVTGKTTVVVIDFDADKSVNVTGNENITVKPVVKLITKETK